MGSETDHGKKMDCQPFDVVAIHKGRFKNTVSEAAFEKG